MKKNMNDFVINSTDKFGSDSGFGLIKQIQRVINETVNIVHSIYFQCLSFEIDCVVNSGCHKSH